MRYARIPLVAAATAIAGLLVAASPPVAPQGCRLDSASTSALSIYECQEKLRIAAEAATRLSAIERNGRLVGLRVSGGAVLVETTTAFQIVTPQAVTEVDRASVAVDAAPEATTVFVREGGASVSQGGRSVSLTGGQGVDIGGQPAAPAPPPIQVSGLEPPSASRPAPQRGAVATRSIKPGLEIKSLNPGRAAGLMARLGQQ